MQLEINTVSNKHDLVTKFQTKKTVARLPMV